ARSQLEHTDPGGQRPDRQGDAVIGPAVSSRCVGAGSSVPKSLIACVFIVLSPRKEEGNAATPWVAAFPLSSFRPVALFDAQAIAATARSAITLIRFAR
ncbi:MAG: hypothetical protein RLT05_08270, partial [Bauldia litoralis]